MGSNEKLLRQRAKVGSALPHSYASLHSEPKVW